MDEKPTAPDSSNTTISGYIQSVSPVKKASYSATRYFNCSIQTNEGPVRAVCFNPEKKANFDKIEAGKTAVKLLNIRKSQKDSVESVIIQNKTTLQPTLLPFPYKEENIASALSSLASLQDVSLEQLVEVKAKLTNLGAVKKQDTRHEQSLLKQEATLVDHTTSIKLVLWEEQCDKLTDGKTYKLKNLRLKESNGTRYLNTPKAANFLFEEIPPFTQTLATVVTDMDTMSQTKISARIIGVQSVSKILSCASCNKKVTLKSNRQTANCQYCKLMQRVSMCSTQWIVKIMFKNTGNNDKIAISLFHAEVQKLTALSTSVINLNIISEDELVLSPLEIDTDLCITYDTATNKLKDISIINI